MKEIFFCKSKVIFTLIYLCIAIGAVVFVNNDAFLYKKTVAEVQKSKITDRYIQKSQNMKKEKYYTQTLTVKILNGKFKGKKACLGIGGLTTYRVIKYIEDNKLYC